jgi:PRTRC genetic system protein E
MFEELMPLVAQRVLVLTLSRVSDEEICVNVIPKPLKSGGRDDDNALATPLSVTGTPKEPSAMTLKLQEPGLRNICNLLISEPSRIMAKNTVERQ